MIGGEPYTLGLFDTAGKQEFVNKGKSTKNLLDFLLLSHRQCRGEHDIYPKIIDIVFS